jgi:hypothetical protein
MKQQGGSIMSKTKIALTLAIVLGSASVAVAAPKHEVRHHQPVATQQVLGADAYGALRSRGDYAYGAVRPTNPVARAERAHEPANIAIQSDDFNRGL